MSIFDAAAELGVFPSGVILGLMTGLISLVIKAERRLKRAAWLVFIGDMLAVMSASFCLFCLGVGMEGHLRYPVVCGMLLGFGAVRSVCRILRNGKPSPKE